MAGEASWYCLGRLTEAPDLSDLHLGSRDEEDPEEGIEAPLRHPRRYAYWPTERDESTLPDIDKLWERELERDEGLRRQVLVAQRRELNRIARIKAKNARERMSEARKAQVEMDIKRYKQRQAEARWCHGSS